MEFAIIQSNSIELFIKPAVVEVYKQEWKLAAARKELQEADFEQRLDHVKLDRRRSHKRLSPRQEKIRLYG